MDTVGYVAPESESAARTVYAELGPTAQTVSREVALALGFDRDEYAERMTSEAVVAARDAMFGSLLTVHVGAFPEFEDWREADPQQEFELHFEGSEHVDHVAWHVSPMTGTIVAASFQDEEEAAVATLRRIAWGRLYRPLFHTDEDQQDS